eukprot:IDg22562t1
MFIRNTTGDCFAAALVNAVFALRGRGAAEAANAVVRRELILQRNLKGLCDVLRRAPGSVVGCEVRREPKGVRQLRGVGKQGEVFRWLASQVHGVCVVHLREDRLVDHAIAIDWNLGQILDTAESQPLGFSVEALRLCGGGNATNL